MYDIKAMYSADGIYYRNAGDSTSSAVFQFTKTKNGLTIRVRVSYIRVSPDLTQIFQYRASWEVLRKIKSTWLYLVWTKWTLGTKTNLLASLQA